MRFWSLAFSFLTGTFSIYLSTSALQQIANPKHTMMTDDHVVLSSYVSNGLSLYIKTN